MPELKPTIWKSEESLLKDYVVDKAAELETDANNRLSGVKTKTGAGYKYAGYNLLREFFDGDQWNHIPEEGGNLRVYNFCAPTVFNYTSFMVNEPPEFDVPSDDIKEPLENERAERKEILLKEILKDNFFSTQFEAIVQIGSALGDSFMVGPFWNSLDKRIYFSTVKRPENIRPIFSSDDYNTIIGYIHDYYLSREIVEKFFSEQIKKRGITLKETPITSELGSSSTDATSQLMVRVRQYWDDKYMLLMLGDKVADYIKHEWGFVPLLYVPNIPHPVKWNGIADIEGMLDSQVEYNEKNANVSDILSAVAGPTIFGKNLSPVSIKSGKMALVDLGDDAELIPDPRQGNTMPLEQVLKDRERNIYALSGLNDIIFGGASVTQSTGRALSVIMQSVNNKIKGRQERWRKALQRLSANIFRLLELYVTGGKELVNGIYDVDIFFPGTLMRNVTDEINKQQRGLQSRFTTMKNLGVPSPKDEETLLEKEKLIDATLQIKIQELITMSQMKMQQQMQPQQPPPEQQQEQGQGGPMLSEGQNQETQPAAAKGVKIQSPASPAGAIAQNAQRTTGVPNIQQNKRPIGNQ
jgi:hypothetical protein